MVEFQILQSNVPRGVWIDTGIAKTDRYGSKIHLIFVEAIDD